MEKIKCRFVSVSQQIFVIHLCFVPVASSSSQVYSAHRMRTWIHRTTLLYRIRLKFDPKIKRNMWANAAIKVATVGNEIDEERKQRENKGEWSEKRLKWMHWWDRLDAVHLHSFVMFSVIILSSLVVLILFPIAFRLRQRCLSCVRVVCASIVLRSIEFRKGNYRFLTHRKGMSSSLSPFQLDRNSSKAANSSRVNFDWLMTIHLFSVQLGLNKIKATIIEKMKRL